jgi:exodeoxyribonuclease VII small subunit
MNEQLTYNKAYAKLEILTKQLEDGDIPLEELSSKVKEANELIAICENKLRAVEDEINESKK